MHKELRIALKDVVSPERLWVLLEAYDLLSTVGLSDQDTELQNILGLQDGISDTNLLVGRVEDLLIYTVGNTLFQYGITVNEETPLSLMTYILDAISRVEYYVIPETLYSIASSDIQPEEVIAQVVPLLSPVTDDDEVFMALTHVSPDTINRLKTISAYQDKQPTPHPDHDKKVALINGIYRETGGRVPVVVTEMAKDGVRLGTPLDAVLEMAFERLDEMNQSRSADIALELLGLVAYSDVAHENMVGTINAVIAEFTDEYSERVRMQTTVMSWVGGSQ